MNESQLRKAAHALGLQFRDGNAYRNHYIGPEDPEWEQMVEEVLATKRTYPLNENGDWVVYQVLPAGEEIVRSRLPPKPIPTKYSQYLDSDTGVSFAEWLLGRKEPRLLTRAECPQYRMVRGRNDYEMVAGEWSATKKEAKASYKLALQRQRVNRKGAT